MIIKKITLWTLVLASMSLMMQAETLSVMVSPRGTKKGSANPGGSAEPLFGTLSGLVGPQYGISSTPGVMEDRDKRSDAPAGAVAVYQVAFPSHPTWGVIAFDLTVAARAAGESAGLLYNGRKHKYWSVDTGDNDTYDTAINEADDEARIRSGETLSFKVENVRSAGNRISSLQLTSIKVSQNGSFDAATGIFTGADGADGSGGRVNQLKFSFEIVAAP